MEERAQSNLNQYQNYSRTSGPEAPNGTGLLAKVEQLLAASKNIEETLRQIDHQLSGQKPQLATENKAPGYGPCVLNDIDAVLFSLRQARALLDDITRAL